MIELRMLIPKSVTNPTHEPMDSWPPVAATAKTPPTIANGMLMRTIPTFLSARSERERTIAIPNHARRALRASSARPRAASSAAPANSR